MTKNFLCSLGLLGMSLALASSAALALTPGQKLTKTEIAEWGALAEYKIGSSRVRVVPPQYSGSQDTLLLNAQGVVGSSRNEVAVSEAPADVQAVIQQTQPRPVSIQHFAPTGITVAKYADFGQAVDALRALKAALPGAKVSLPVQFSKQVPY
ncbi:hypothetical protein CSC67_06890 [Pusillimonas caeni]|uniref:hypothetical protein n=1 Tax=Pusillimonas caeni TaxID=1348472 RepID=UPI000E59A667|nr:hypothetical protein [Pusillimonas caeni]TFL15050.1 hypothetical protein CSC67_06890 [Pusillimonas caeni]